MPALVFHPDATAPKHSFKPGPEIDHPLARGTESHKMRRTVSLGCDHFHRLDVFACSKAG